MYQEARFKEIVKNINKGIIVNLGSEFGLLHSFIKVNFPSDKVIGIDIIGDPEIKQDLNQKINLPDNWVNTVVCGELLEHIDNPLELLREIYRILKHDGNLIITVANPTALSSLMKKYSGYKTNLNYDDHYHSFNESNLYNILTKANFKISEIKFFESFHKLDKKMFWGYVITKLFPILKSNIFVVVHKA